MGSVQRLHRLPGLASITLEPGKGGIAYSARLVERSLNIIAGRAPWIATLDPRQHGAVSLGERLRFTARLAAVQWQRRLEFLVYDHVGIARVQRMLPSSIRVPYAVLVYDRDAWTPDLNPVRKAVLREARVRIACSQFTAEQVEAAHPDVGPIIACPLALLPEPAGGAVDEARLAQVRPRSVLIVSRISSADRYKGHDQLLECWPAVRSKVPDAQLVIAGAGDDLARLRTKAQALELGDSVLFLGFVAEATLQALFRRVAAFAMPSTGEGFGLVYLEAMRAGLPCIASARGPAREILRQGREGFLVGPDDHAALAAAASSLLLEPERRRAMGEAGYRRFQESFTFVRFHERFAPILENAFGPVGFSEAA